MENFSPGFISLTGVTASLCAPSGLLAPSPPPQPSKAPATSASVPRWVHRIMIFLAFSFQMPGLSPSPPMLTITETWYFEMQTLRKVERKSQPIAQTGSLVPAFSRQVDSSQFVSS